MDMGDKGKGGEGLQTRQRVGKLGQAWSMRRSIWVWAQSVQKMVRQQQQQRCGGGPSGAAPGHAGRGFAFQSPGPQVTNQRVQHIAHERDLHTNTHARNMHMHMYPRRRPRSHAEQRTPTAHICKRSASPPKASTRARPPQHAPPCRQAPTSGDVHGHQQQPLGLDVGLGPVQQGEGHLKFEALSDGTNKSCEQSVEPIFYRREGGPWAFAAGVLRSSSLQEPRGMLLYFVSHVYSSRGHNTQGRAALPGRRAGRAGSARLSVDAKPELVASSPGATLQPHLCSRRKRDPRGTNSLTMASWLGWMTAPMNSTMLGWRRRDMSWTCATAIGHRPPRACACVCVCMCTT